MDVQMELCPWDLVGSSTIHHPPLPLYEPEYWKIPSQEWNTTNGYYVYDQPTLNTKIFPQDWEATRLNELEKLSNYCQNYISTTDTSKDWKDEIIELFPTWAEQNTMELLYPMIDSLPFVGNKNSKSNTELNDMDMGVTFSELQSAFLAIESELDLIESHDNTFYDSETAAERVLPKSKKTSRSKDARKPSSRSRPNRSKNGPYPCMSLDHVVIGPFGTLLPLNTYLHIDWTKTESAVIRYLLLEIFGPEVLATHKLPTNEPRSRIENNILEMTKVGDILFLVTNNMNTTEEEVLRHIKHICNYMSMLGKSYSPRLMVDANNESRWFHEISRV